MRYSTRFVWSIAGILMTMTATQAFAQDKSVWVSFGAGLTSPNSEVRERLGDGYNINFGLQFDVTPNIAIEGLYSFNGLGEKGRSIQIADVPGGPTRTEQIFGDMNMQYGTASVIFKGSGATVKPYALAGLGIYYRPVKITTPGVGYVPGYCDPWWYICYPGGWVEVDTILASRSSTDFGMVFGGGANFGIFYSELRYHYMWGPEIPTQSASPPVNPPVATDTRKANGKFLALTFGLRF
jgi:opacity protein-like surface antigen